EMPDSSSLIGQIISHYRIVEKLGAGGMGEVYRARDEHLKRDVAFKILQPDSHGGAGAGGKILREARSASALNDPHICTIHEVGEAGGYHFIVMELVEGRPLNSLIPLEGLRPELVVRYGAQIAAALAHAHDHGIIHRYIKTANVVITPSGQVKVLDFGLAKFYGDREFAESTRSTQSAIDASAIVGTLPYIAPEILRGEEAGARSDIWSLGVTLYEMSAGNRPFRGQTAFELTSGILREPLPPFPPQLPAGLRTVIERCLEKEPGHRYQRASEVRAALEAVHTPRATFPSTVPVSVTPPSSARRSLWIPGVIAIAVLAAALFAADVGGLRDRVFHRAFAPVIHSLAVLPLENLSGDSQQQYFADGMTEELTTELSQVRSLRVVSRTSTMRYKGTQKSVPEIARDLNVDAVVEGSVEREGDRVRITAQLIEARTDRHLWAESYERDLRDILALQGEVARAIAGEIRIQVTPEEKLRMASARRVDPEVHQLYLRGRFYWNKRNREDIGKGLEYFQEVVRKDPEYALGYVGIADSYLLLGQWGFMAPREAYPQLKEAAEHALRMDESLGEAHAPLAYYLRVYEMDWQGAEREFKRAIELNSSYANAHHWYSHFLVDFRRFDESLRESRLALALDPMDTTLNTHLGWHYMEAGQYAEAIRQLQSTLELFPRFGQAHFYLGQTYERQHLTGQAIAEFENATKLPGNQDQAMMTLACVYAESGRTDEARKT